MERPGEKNGATGGRPGDTGEPASGHQQRGQGSGNRHTSVGKFPGTREGSQARSQAAPVNSTTGSATSQNGQPDAAQKLHTAALRRQQLTALHYANLGLAVHRTSIELVEGEDACWAQASKHPDTVASWKKGSGNEPTVDPDRVRELFPPDGEEAQLYGVSVHGGHFGDDRQLRVVMIDVDRRIKNGVLIDGYRNLLDMVGGSERLGKPFVSISRPRPGDDSKKPGLHLIYLVPEKDLHVRLKGGTSELAPGIDTRGGGPSSGGLTIESNGWHKKNRWLPFVPGLNDDGDLTDPDGNVIDPDALPPPKFDDFGELIGGAPELGSKPGELPQDLLHLWLMRKGEMDPSTASPRARVLLDEAQLLDAEQKYARQLEAGRRETAKSDRERPTDQRKLPLKLDATGCTHCRDKFEVAKTHLSYIPPEVGRDLWRNIVWGVHAMLDGCQCGQQLVREWSLHSTNPKHSDGADAAEQLYVDEGTSKRHSTERIGDATLIAVARICGSPESADFPEAKMFEIAKKHALTLLYDGGVDVVAKRLRQLREVFAGGPDDEPTNSSPPNTDESPGASGATSDSGDQRDGVSTVRSVLMRALAEGPLVHQATGIAKLDELMRGGPCYGDPVVMNGAPDAGKTMLLAAISDEFLRVGVAVGFLAVDEKDDDLVARFMQRRGWSRELIESRDPDVFQAMMRRGDTELRHLNIYEPDWTIERAADDLARYAKRHGLRAALFIDSVQTVTCKAEQENDGDTARIKKRMAAFRDQVRAHRLIGFAASEMNRDGYRESDQKRRKVSDMAVGSGSSAIEYLARVVVSVRSVANRSDLIELRLPKNKLGRSHREEEHGLFLRIDRTRQMLTPDGDYDPVLADEEHEKKRSTEKAEREDKQAVLDAGRLAAAIAREPGRGWNKLKAEFAAKKGRPAVGEQRLVRAKGKLGDALVMAKGANRSKLHYLDGVRVPDDVRAALECGLQAEVAKSVVPDDIERVE